MKQIHKLVLAAAVASLGFVANAQAQTKDITLDPKQGVLPYDIDARGVVVRNSTGLCWRTGYWTAQLAQETKVVGETLPAGCFCDKDLMPKEVCEPKVKAADAPAAATPAAPAATPKPSAEKVTLAADTLFEYDRAELTTLGKTKLSEFALKAQALNIEVIIAVGHADRIGSDSYNQKLSEKRAASVKAHLVSKGIEANRIYTEGKGETQPVTGDKCKSLGKEGRSNKKLIECLQPDRRVEIEVVGTK